MPRPHPGLLATAAEILRASDRADVVAVAQALEAIDAGGGQVDDLVAIGAGGEPENRVARDAAIAEARDKFFSNHSARRAAELIAAGLARYAATRWPAEAGLTAPPEAARGTVRELYWRTLRASPRVPSPESIRKKWVMEPSNDPGP